MPCIVRSFIIVLLITVACRAEEPPPPKISGDYVIVSVFKMLDKPGQVRIQSADGKKAYKLREGREDEPFTLVSLKWEKKPVLAELRGPDGKTFWVTEKESNPNAYNESLIKDAQARGLIDANGKLTEQCKKAMTNNLRQVASGGLQYILENGTASAQYKDLVPIYFQPINPVCGEDYTKLTVSEDGGAMSVTALNGEVVEYKY